MMAPKAVLVGPPGAGKSTIGRRLAQALDLPLFDTDVAVEEEAGRTIAEIFVQEGEPAFRALEEEIVRKAIESDEAIVLLGGGGGGGFGGGFGSGGGGDFGGGGASGDW